MTITIIGILQEGDDEEQIPVYLDRLEREDEYRVALEANNLTNDEGN